MIIETILVLLCRVCWGMVLSNTTTPHIDSDKGATASIEEGIKLDEASVWRRSCYYGQWYANVVRHVEKVMEDKCRDAGPEYVNRMVDNMVDATMSFSEREFDMFMYMMDTNRIQRDLNCFIVRDDEVQN